MSHTVGTPIAITGIFNDFLSNFSLLLETPLPGCIPVSVSCIALFNLFNELVLSESIIEIDNPKQINELKNTITELSNYDMEISKFIEKIDAGKAYKMELRAKEKQLKELVKKANTISKKVNVNEIKSKYKHFPARKRYSEFTGIDSKFFVNIK